MTTLYLTEQRSIVRKTSDRLIVEKDKQVLLEVPCLKLETVLIFGNVQVTTQALIEMLDHGIELAFLSLSGQLRGQLTPPKAKNVPLRMRQYEVSKSEADCLKLARQVVSGKIANSRTVLRRLRRHAPEVPLEPIQRLEELKISVEQARSMESLLGTEGTAAAQYFPAIGTLAPAWVKFDGRNRRPPRDALNALLSFGYVLVGNEIQCLLDAKGFDPYIGFFHRLDYGRPSLALDLLEEFRAALVDRFSLSLLQRSVLGLDDFRSTPEGGVLLRRESMKSYFPAYEKEMTTPIATADGETLTIRHLFRRQAERLARALMHGELYHPFQLPC